MVGMLMVARLTTSLSSLVEYNEDSSDRSCCLMTLSDLLLSSRMLQNNAIHLPAD